MVCLSVRFASLCLSVPALAHSSKPVAAGLLHGPGGHKMSIDFYMAGAQQQRRAAGECGQCRVVSVRT